MGMRSAGKRGSPVTRAIAVVMVCLFAVSNVAWAYPHDGDTRHGIGRENLAPQSIFKPLQDEGIEDSAELVFELLAGTRLLLTDATKTPLIINAFLDEMYKGETPLSSGTESRRKIDFRRVMKREGPNITVQFAVRDRPGILFEVEYRDTVTDETTGDISVADAGFARAAAEGTIRYADVFQKDDRIRIRTVETRHEAVGDNVTCGTICQAGHQDLLDPQLKAYYRDLRKTANEKGAKIRKKIVTGHEVIDALDRTGKLAALGTTREQLESIIASIRQHAGIPDDIDILFAVPPHDEELWLIDDPDSGKELYGGGHFNGDGTRIHISLPLILSQKDPAGAARAIARHEYTHITGQGHADDEGMKIVHDARARSLLIASASLATVAARLYAKDKRDKPEKMLDVARLCRRCGNAREAEFLLNEALPSVRSRQSDAQKAIGLSRFAKEYAALGSVDLAGSLVAEARGIADSLSLKVDTCIALSDAFIELGLRSQALAMLQTAVSLLETAPANRTTVPILNEIARQYGALGLTKEALALYEASLERFKQPWPVSGEMALGEIEDSIFRATIRGIVSFGRMPQTARLLATAVEIVKDSPLTIDTPDALAALTEAYAAFGDRGFAEKLLVATQEAAAWSPDWRDTSRVKLSLGRALAACGKDDETIAALGKVRGVSGVPASLAKLARIYWRIGEKDLALQYASRALMLSKNVSSPAAGLSAVVDTFLEMQGDGGREVSRDLSARIESVFSFLRSGVAAHEDLHTTQDLLFACMSTGALGDLEKWIAGGRRLGEICKDFVKLTDTDKKRYLEGSAAELARIKTGHFDAHDPVHVMLGYDMLLELVKRNPTLKKEISYADYKKLFTRRAFEGGLYGKEGAEVTYMCYEALRLMQFLRQLKNETSRPIVVVQNLTYGWVTSAFLENEFAAMGIKVIKTKAGSTYAHNHPTVMHGPDPQSDDADLFHKDDLAYIVKNEPIVVVIDGTYSLDPTVMANMHRRHARLPDAHQAYRNYFHALSGHPRDADFGIDGLKTKSGEDLGEELRGSHLYRKVRERAKRIRPADQRANYSFRFWYTGKRSSFMCCSERVEREFPEEMSLVNPADTSRPRFDRMKGPTVIFAIANMEDEAIDERVRVKGIYHNSAYFDDKDTFGRAFIAMTRFGPKLSDAFTEATTLEYERLKKMFGVRSPVARALAQAPAVIPVRSLILDFDDTLVPFPGTIAEHPDTLAALESLLGQGMPVAIITEESEEKMELRLWADIKPELRKNLHIFSNGGTRYVAFDEHGVKASRFVKTIDPRKRDAIKTIVTKALPRQSAAAELYHFEDRDYKVKISLRDRHARKEYADRLRDAFHNAGIRVTISFQGRHHINIHTFSKVEAARYFDEEVLKPAGVDLAEAFVFGNKVRSYGGDRALFEALDTSFRINVGSASPTLRDDKTVHLDRQGPASVHAILQNIAFHQGHLDRSDPDLPSEMCTEMANASKELGGPAALKEAQDEIIRKAIQDDRVVKLRFEGGEAKFYHPAKKLVPGGDAIGEPYDGRDLLGTFELIKLKGYLEHSGIDDPESITIGVIRGAGYINPAPDDSFSIVHAGERTRTIWFGEHALRDLLKSGDPDDARAIFAHDVKHIIDPAAAESEHTTDEYKELAERIRKRALFAGTRFTRQDEEETKRRLAVIFGDEAEAAWQDLLRMAAAFTDVSDRSFFLDIQLPNLLPEGDESYEVRSRELVRRFWPMLMERVIGVAGKEYAHHGSASIFYLFISRRTPGEWLLSFALVDEAEARGEDWADWDRWARERIGKFWKGKVPAGNIYAMRDPTLYNHDGIRVTYPVVAAFVSEFGYEGGMALLFGREGEEGRREAPLMSVLEKGLLSLADDKRIAEREEIGDLALWAYRNDVDFTELVTGLRALAPFMGDDPQIMTMAMRLGELDKSLGSGAHLLPILSEVATWSAIPLREDAAARMSRLMEEPDLVSFREGVLSIFLSNFMGDDDFYFDGRVMNPTVLARMLVTEGRFQDEKYLNRYLSALMGYKIQQKLFFEEPFTESRAVEWIRDIAEYQDSDVVREEKALHGPLYERKSFEALTTAVAYLAQRANATGVRYRIDEAQAGRASYAWAFRATTDELLNSRDRFSGHLALHVTRDQVFLEDILRAGHLVPGRANDGMAYDRAGELTYKGERVRDLIRTRFVHFFIHRLQAESWVNGMGSLNSARYGFVYPVELLLENHSFTHSPLHVRDFAVGGPTHDVTDTGGRVPTAAGILLAPKKDRKALEELFASLEKEVPGWQRPNKVYYYAGANAKEGFDELSSRRADVSDEVRISRMPQPIDLMLDGAFKNDYLAYMPGAHLSVRPVEPTVGAPHEEVGSFERILRQSLSVMTDGLSFVDIGSGPTGFFGVELVDLCSSRGIPVRSAISVDNAMVDPDAVAYDQVRYADITHPEDRASAGIVDGAQDLVTINNIVNLALLDPALVILKPGGVLMVTFAETDVQSDYTSIVADAQERIRRLSESDPAHAYTLLGEDGTIAVPADYPQTNDRSGSGFHSRMLMVTKTPKADFQARQVALSHQITAASREMREAVEEIGALPVETSIVALGIMDKLIENAADEVGLRADAEGAGALPEKPIQVTARYDEDAGALQIVLRDSGRGIPREILEKWQRGEFLSTKDTSGRTKGSDGRAVREALRVSGDHHFAISFATRTAEGDSNKFIQDPDGQRRVEPGSAAEVGTTVTLTVPVSPLPGGVLARLADARRLIEDGAKGDELLSAIELLEEAIRGLRDAGAGEQLAEAEGLLARAQDAYDRGWTLKLSQYPDPSATFTGRTLHTASVVKALAAAGDTVVEVGVGDDGAPTFRDVQGALGSEVLVKGIEFRRGNIPADLAGDVAQGNILALRPDSDATAFLRRAKVVRICNLVDEYFSRRQRERLLDVLAEHMQDGAWLIISTSIHDPMREDTEEAGLLYRKIDGNWTLQYSLRSFVDEFMGGIQIGDMVASPIAADFTRVPDGLAAPWQEHPVPPDRERSRSNVRQIGLDELDDAHRDERELMREAKRYLKNLPVNELIDLSVIPRGEAQLKANMETIARMIAWHAALGLDVRYAFEHAPYPAYESDAYRFLRESLHRIAALPGVNLNIERLLTLHGDPDTLTVRLRDVDALRTARIDEHEIPVGLIRDMPGKGACLPDYTGASAMGLALAGLRVAREKEEQHVYKQKRGEVLERFRSILTRHGVDTSELTEDAIEVLAHFSPEARRELIITFALPPIVKAAVELLFEYHRAMQVLLQAA